MRYYECLYTVRILVDMPPCESPDLDELRDLLDRCINDDLVGEPVAASVREISGRTMASLLHEAGSEPGFFQLDDEGQPV